MRTLRRLWWRWRDRKLPYPLKRVTLAEFDALVESYDG